MCQMMTCNVNANSGYGELRQLRSSRQAKNSCDHRYQLVSAVNHVCVERCCSIVMQSVEVIWVGQMSQKFRWRTITRVLWRWTGLS